MRAERERPGVVTLYCDGCDRFHVYLHKLEDGTVSEIDAFKPSAQDQAKPGRKPETLHRRGPTRCLAKRCQLIAREGGLCETHYAGWCADGRPADREAWAAAQIDLDKGRRATATAPTSTEPPADPAIGGFVDEPSTTSPIIEPPPAVVPASTPDQETTPVNEMTCLVPGCGKTWRAQKRSTGLCHRHQSMRRYHHMVDQPVMVFVESLMAGGSQPKAKTRNPSKSVATPGDGVNHPAPATLGTAPMVGLMNESVIELPEGVRQLRIFTLGRFVTLADHTGRIIAQVPPSAA